MNIRLRLKLYKLFVIVVGFLVIFLGVYDLFNRQNWMIEGYKSQNAMIVLSVLGSLSVLFLMGILVWKLRIPEKLVNDDNLIPELKKKERNFIGLLKVLISISVALFGADAIFTALDVDYRTLLDTSNAGRFVHFGVSIGLYFLTNWLLGRLPYFSNKRGA